MSLTDPQLPQSNGHSDRSRRIFLLVQACSQRVSSLALLLTMLAVPTACSFGQENALSAAYTRLAADRAASTQTFDLLKKLVRTTSPAVAHIEAQKPRKTAGRSETHAKVAMIEEAGSGVVIAYRNRYFVITNYHVIEGAESSDIRVVVDEHLYRPVDVRHDRETDLSVILLEDVPMQAAQIGNSDEVEVGEFVVAIGSPFGLEHSVSYGIISARGRHNLELGPQGVKYQDFFQTDASINPGNSGGPLFDLAGNVIGINTAIASNSGGSDGIGFSIPINMAMRVVRDLIDYGYVRRGFLGVSLSSDFNAERAMEKGMRQAFGAEISVVNPGSPAEKAQLHVGDVILKVGGKRVASDSHLVTLISLLPIGQPETLTIFREGNTFDVQVAMDQR